MAKNLSLTAIITEFKFIESSAVRGTATTTRTETKTKINLMFVETKIFDLNAEAANVARK